MNRLITRVLVAFLTLIVGTATAELWLYYRRTIPQPAKAELNIVAELKPASQSLTFENTGQVSMFLVDYNTSDGRVVRFSCYERDSASDATKELKEKILYTKTPIIERTPKLNDKGEKVGDRVVFKYLIGLESKIYLSWTEGSQIFHVYAPSLKYARAFELSRAWSDRRCASFWSKNRM